VGTQKIGGTTMKTKLLFLLIILSGIRFSSAACGNSVFRLTIKGHGAYMVYVDDLASTGFSNDFLFNGLLPGRHRITILKPSDNHTCGWSRRMNVVCDVTVRLLPGRVTMAYFNRFDGFHIYQTTLAEAPDLSNDTYDYFDGPMCNRDFNELLQVVNACDFECTRMEVVQHAIRDHKFTTSQIAQLLSFFTFESSRLEIAKSAYLKTIDRKRYYELFNSFTFDSSKRELSDFMHNA
jgi:hypothetical protein